MADALEWALANDIETAPSVSLYSQMGTLDLDSARAIAARESIATILTGSVQTTGDDYRVTIVGIDASNGEPRFSASESMASERGLLEGVAALADEVLEELDIDAGTRTAAPTTTSFAALRAFVQGRAAIAVGDLENAATLLSNSVGLDADFGNAYAQLALTEASLGRLEAAEAHWSGALAHTDAMSERERLRNLARYYKEIAFDNDAATVAYKDLIEKYPVDGAARSDYARLAFITLDYATAVEQTRHALAIYPNSDRYLVEMAWYAMYAGDWSAVADAIERTAPVDGVTPPVLVPAAAVAVSQGDAGGARDIFASRPSSDDADAQSFAALGLADVDLFLGRVRDAANGLRAAIDMDIQDQRHAAAAMKYVVLAESLAEQGDLREAAATAESATGLSNATAVTVSAALTFIRSGNLSRARLLAETLVAERTAVERAYGRMLQGVLLQAEQEPVDAVFALREAAEVADLWLVRYLLGRAYLEAGYFTEALDELTVAANRNGEAMALFQDGLPSFRYLSELSYWVGRAQEGLSIPNAARASYQEFIALRPENGVLTQDAQRRIATLD